MGARPGRFWGSAALASLVVAGGVAGAGPLVLRLDPQPGLRPLTSGEFWLLTVFTLGMLALLLGIAVGVGGWLRGLLLGDVMEASASSDDGEPGEGPSGDQRQEGIDPAWWTAAVGVHLLAIYWAGWWVMG